MTLREVLNKYAALKPIKKIAKAAFEKLYGFTGEDRWLKMLADHSTTPVTIILDVGSSGGHYLGKAARFFPKAEFHHFEPRPDAAARLKSFLRTLKTNSAIHELALSNNVGSAQFAILDYGDASSLVIADMGKLASVEKVITVPTEKLDNIPGIGPTPDLPIGLFKIDVEGAELNVLKGAYETLSRVSNLQLEISALRHVGGHRETIEIFQTVFDAGFDLVDTTDSNYLFTKDPGILALFGKRAASRAG